MKWHSRQSIRLKGYDYSLAGLYYVTICTKNKENYFGDIIVDDVFVGTPFIASSNSIILNEKGKIAERYWQIVLDG